MVHAAPFRQQTRAIFQRLYGPVTTSSCSLASKLRDITFEKPRGNKMRHGVNTLSPAFHFR